MNDAFWIPGATRAFDGQVVEVGAEHRPSDHLVCFLHVLLQYHSQRIDFLAGGTPQGPDPDGLVDMMMRKNTRQNGALQRVETLGITEKIRDADENVLIERINLSRVVQKKRPVCFDAV